MELIQVSLPKGAHVADRWLRTATLRPLNGDDGAFLAVDGRTLTPFERTSRLLERCLVKSDDKAVGVVHLPSLTVGDREAMLLNLYRGSFGSGIPATLVCPGCNESLEFDVAAENLLLEPEAQPTAATERVVSSDGKRYRCTIRPPTGADVEAVLPLAAEGPDEAAAELFARCVTVIDDESLQTVEAPDPSLIGLLDEAFDSLDPQAETRLALRCAACGLDFDGCLDAGEILTRTARRKSDELFQEVHLLALHYHWSESELLAMSQARRRVYLDLIGDDEVGRA